MPDRLTAIPDVAVIGAGIVGASCALSLQKSGLQVCLLDRARPGQGASYGNAGTFASYGCIPLNSPTLIHRLPRLLFSHNSPLAVHWPSVPSLLPWLTAFLRNCSRNRVEQIISALGNLLTHAEAAMDVLIDDAGAGDLVSKRGTLYLYITRQGFDAADWEINQRRGQGVRVDVLSLDEALSLEGALAPIFHRGLFFRDAKHFLDPHLLVERFVESTVSRGGEFLVSEVKNIRWDGAGNVRLRLANADEIVARHLVIAAGAWSKPLVASIRERIPLSVERGYHLMFPDDAGLISRPVAWGESGVYFTPMHEGLRAAGTVELGALSAPENPKRIRYIERHARRLLPQLGVEGDSWLGFRPTLPDSLPVIGQSRVQSNLYFAFGHQHLGLTLSGITGQLITELIQTGRTQLDLTPFRLDRFG